MVRLQIGHAALATGPGLQQNNPQLEIQGPNNKQGKASWQVLSKTLPWTVTLLIFHSLE